MVGNSQHQAVSEEFFAGTGEMAALMRSRNWAKTAVGPAQKWPQSLKTTIRILLTSRFSMWMGWGDDITFFYNDAYKKDTLGVKHPWALGAPAREVWAEIWADVGPRIEKVLRTGEATWDEALLLFLQRSGYTEETYHTFSYSPLANEEGVISGMLCVVTEETQRIIGERRLRLLQEIASSLASAQTIEATLNAITRSLETDSRDIPFTLLYLFEADGKAARRAGATGIPQKHPLAAPMIGQEDKDTPWPLSAFHADFKPLLVTNLAALFNDLPCGPWEKPPHQAIIVPVAQQGQERPAGFLIAALNPYRTFDDDYRGFLDLLVGQIASSLANARAYEEEKRRAEALAELDRAKTAFFGNVSHEFRTPLTLMLAPMEDALEDSGALRGENLAIVHRNGLRLLKLVNTLLDFSRIEAGRVQASFEPTDLAALTEELASVFRSAMEKAGLKFSVECAALSEPVFIDRDMWEKIVLNLLSNAFKFTLEGEITVKLSQRDGQAILAIRDTGTGISAEQLPHIFERFHRVEGVRARTHEGTGIGLALVRELVHLHGGAVGVESASGVGTLFTVTIPMGKQHLPSNRLIAPTPLSSTALRADSFVEEALRWLPEGTPAKPASNAATLPLSEKFGNADAKRACIVLADDNADMRDYVQNLLRSQYDVIAVADGEAALRTAREVRADMVISDVMMPLLDGFGLLKALRKDAYTASIPVILLSARAGEEARIEGLAAGADDYMTKPFSARELLARVSSHLELSRVRREAEQSIRQSEERFRVALSNVPLTVFTCDRELRYTWVANAVEGFSEEQYLGKRDDEFQPAEEIAEFTAFKQGVLDSEKGARKEIVHASATGTRFYDMTAEPLRNQENEIIGLTVAAFDITVLRQYDIDLAAMNARLQRAMTETHHRVKNNLQLMSALIDMQRLTGAETIPISELTRLGANVRALGVIHDILTQEAKDGSDQETLSVKAVLDKLTEVLRQTMGERTLKTEFDDARILGRQATALALVTNELVSNALKHGKGEIGIALKIHGDAATLEVRDDGPGFPEGFDPTEAANTGIELVENVVGWDLNGKTSYSTHPTGGAIISVTFPIATRSHPG